MKVQMKYFTLSTRFAALLSFWTALFSPGALFAGFSQAAPLASGRGSTGQALALSAALRGYLLPTARSRPTFQEMGVPANTRRGPDGRYIYSKSGLMRSGAIFKPPARPMSPRLMKPSKPLMCLTRRRASRPRRGRL